MATNPRSISTSWISNLIVFAVLGGGLGYLFSGGLFISMEETLLLYAIGFAWAALALQAGQAAGQAVDLLAKPATGLDVTDPEAVKAQVESLDGSHAVSGRAKRLLAAWAQGWNPREVVGLAAYQSARARKPVFGHVAFALVVFGLALQQGQASSLVLGGLVLAGLVLLARLSLHGRTDQYLEEMMLTRLPGNLPNTAITAAQLGDAVGAAIEKAFSLHVPNPEKTAAAIGGAVEGAGKMIAAEADKIQKALAQVQASLAESLPGAGKSLAAELAKAQTQLSTSLAESGQKMGDQLANVHQKMGEQLAGVQKSLVGGMAESGMQAAEAIRRSQSELSAGLASAVKQVVDILAAVQKSLEGSLSGAGREAAQQLTAGLSGYADRLDASTQALTGEIQQLGIAQQSIEKLLHVEEAVEGTLKSIAAMDEFKDTLHALRTHIEASDKLLKEVAKPRTITLVEEDGEARAV